MGQGRGRLKWAATGQSRAVNRAGILIAKSRTVWIKFGITLDGFKIFFVA